MLYLFSFKKLENPILLSKERNIYLKNIQMIMLQKLIQKDVYCVWILRKIINERKASEPFLV